MIRIIVLIASLTFIAACEPIGPVPGGSLDGTVVPLPKDLDAIGDVEVVQLEMAGPYSVNIWGVVRDGNYYVAAARGADTNWVSRIRNSPEVRLRVDQEIFELRAVAVTAESELDRVADAYKQKYDLDAQEDFPDVIVFRLEPRA